MYCEASRNQQPVILESMPQAEIPETYSVITGEIERRIEETTNAALRIMSVLIGDAPQVNERPPVRNLHEKMQQIRDGVRNLMSLVDDIEAYIKGRD